MLNGIDAWTSCLEDTEGQCLLRQEEKESPGETVMFEIHKNSACGRSLPQ